MSFYKTTAIIIKTKDFGETDKLLTLYSKEFGKIIVRAKGIRKITSKLSGYLDLLNIAEFLLIKGRSIDTIVGVATKNSFINLKKNLRKVSLSYNFLELVERLTPERERHDKIFDLLEETLLLLEEKDKGELLKAVFEFKLLDELGYKPLLKNCVVCKKDSDGKRYFDFKKGSVICNSCKTEDMNLDTISKETIMVLNAFEKLEMRKIFNIRGINQKVKGVKPFLKKFNYYIFNNIYKTELFLAKIKD